MYLLFYSLLFKEEKKIINFNKAIDNYSPIILVIDLLNNEVFISKKTQIFNNNLRFSLFVFLNCLKHKEKAIFQKYLKNIFFNWENESNFLKEKITFTLNIKELVKTKKEIVYWLLIKNFDKKSKKLYCYLTNNNQNFIFKSFSFFNQKIIFNQLNNFNFFEKMSSFFQKNEEEKRNHFYFLIIKDYQKFNFFLRKKKIDLIWKTVFFKLKNYFKKLKIKNFLISKYENGYFLFFQDNVNNKFKNFDYFSKKIHKLSFFENSYLKLTFIFDDFSSFLLSKNNQKNFSLNFENYIFYLNKKYNLNFNQFDEKGEFDFQKGIKIEDHLSKNFFLIKKEIFSLLDKKNNDYLLDFKVKQIDDDDIFYFKRDFFQFYNWKKKWLIYKLFFFKIIKDKDFIEKISYAADNIIFTIDLSLLHKEDLFNYFKNNLLILKHVFFKQKTLSINFLIFSDFNFQNLIKKILIIKNIGFKIGFNISNLKSNTFNIIQSYHFDFLIVSKKIFGNFFYFNENYLNLANFLSFLKNNLKIESIIFKNINYEEAYFLKKNFGNLKFIY
jgi:hypothetical protein